MYDIFTVSSLNLRTRRGKLDRTVKEPFRYYCSFCDKRRTLGINSSVLTKVHYAVQGTEVKSKMCDKCVDVFTDCLRHGPKVIDQLHRWERRSRVVRVSLVEGERFCHMCLGTHKSHIFVKYDDVEIPGLQENYEWVRVCARCALCYMEMLRETAEVNSAKLPYVAIEEFAHGVVVK